MQLLHQKENRMMNKNRLVMFSISRARTVDNEKQWKQKKKSPQ